jgi:hypothetical protein
MQKFPIYYSYGIFSFTDTDNFEKPFAVIQAPNGSRIESPWIVLPDGGKLGAEEAFARAVARDNVNKIHLLEMAIGPDTFPEIER